MTTPTALPTGQHPTQPRRRSLMFVLAGGAALASLPAMAQPTAGKADILIGRSTALSGGMAPFLSPIHEGQDAAIEDANAKGGIGGRKVRADESRAEMAEADRIEAGDASAPGQ